ncbi:hypothetical protein HDU67_007807 [Dinochytrium kinnereticum]|nr:hypothetical protein HDU67_007807 [Dinochytrium kinnereticum]
MFNAINKIDHWTKRQEASIPNFIYATAGSTVLYSMTLCAVLYCSFIRASALSGMGASMRRRFEVTGWLVVGLMFAARLVRTGLIFRDVAMNAPEIFLQPSITAIQILTLVPTLCIRVLLDSWTLCNLYRSRVKYVEQTGREAFAIITGSL